MLVAAIETRSTEEMVEARETTGRTNLCKGAGVDECVGSTKSENCST